MKIVIVSTGALIPDEPVGAIPESAVLRVLTASSDQSNATDALLVPLAAGPLSGAADWLYAHGQGNAVLRMLLRLSPLDRGARFWRAVRKDPRVSGFLAATDLLVAGDRDANFACWQLARRTGVVAVSGYPAAERELASRRAA